jgi:D-amino-acid dehydrogenase
MRIAVIGAGIVGMATAWWLRRDGHDVTVIDAAAGPGTGTSFANGAQLSWSYVAPMASPAVLRSVAKYLFDSSSPVRFLPRMDPGQWAWALRFLAACGADAAASGTAKLLALSFHSRDMLQAMLAETPMAFDHARNGKLVVHSSASGMADAVAQMQLQAALGCEQFALTAAECIALEPGLASIAHRLAGGIHTPSEEVGDCHKLCLELHRVLAARGVSFRFGCTVTGMVREGTRIRALTTSTGAVETELYVLAAGIGSRALAEAAGISAPLQPIRGYSITARVANSNAAPVRSITDLHVKTVYAPLAGTVRAAGFAELGATDTSIAPEKIETLRRNLAETFPGACDMSALAPWSGLRPATPNDLPRIGRTRLDNLLVNLGQGSLGFTLSAGSARLLADIVAGRPPAIAAADYAPR